MPLPSKSSLVTRTSYVVPLYIPSAPAHDLISNSYIRMLKARSHPPTLPRISIRGVVSQAYPTKAENDINVAQHHRARIRWISQDGLRIIRHRPARGQIRRAGPARTCFRRPTELTLSTNSVARVLKKCFAHLLCLSAPRGGRFKSPRSPITSATGVQELRFTSSTPASTRPPPPSSIFTIRLPRQLR